jgi:hypothetical protein
LVDLSFATVTNVDFRNVLRECFVAFAMVFHDTDSLKVGKGISRAVVIRLFAVVSSMEGGCLPSSINEEELSDYMDNATLILDTLETMNLVQRAGHGLSKSSAMNRLGNVSDNDLANTNGSNHKCYSMHESVSVHDICCLKSLFISDPDIRIHSSPSTDQGYCGRYGKAENRGICSSLR